MSWPTDVFKLDDLKGLDAEQLKTLRDEIVRQIRTDPEILALLKRKVDPVRVRLKGGG